MAKEQRNYYFRCQYQVSDKLTISEVVEQEGYISIAQMMLALCLLVRKVSLQVDKKTGGRAALAVVNRFKNMVLNIQQDTKGTGASKSDYLDHKSKHKANRSERLDVEFYGFGGKDDGKIEDISKFLTYFRKLLLEKPSPAKKRSKTEKLRKVSPKK